MADKSQQLIIEALQRAVSAGNGIPLFASRTVPGLFAATAPARRAAQLCKEQGYLQVIRTENKGKSSCEVCAISEQGLAYLLAEQSPKLILESLVQALQQQAARVDDIAAALHGNQETLEALKTVAERVLQQFRTPPPAPASNNGNGKASCAADVIDRLQHWQAAGALGDCPLPNLFRHVADKHPLTSIGQFHDVLRRLYEEQKIYLHPWTGPMYEIPDPKLALMVGHEIAWYVSLR